MGVWYRALQTGTIKQHYNVTLTDDGTGTGTIKQHYNVTLTGTGTGTGTGTPLYCSLQSLTFIESETGFILIL